MKNNEQEISVVLGGTGGIGSAVVRELIEKKREVRVVTRNESSARELFKGMKVEIVQADMLSLEQTRKAVEGAEAVTGREFIEMIFSQLGYKPKMKVLKKGTISFLSPFVPIVKEIKELLDQWEHPFVIDGSKYREMTGINGYTPHDEAIARTLAWFKGNN